MRKPKIDPYDKALFMDITIRQENPGDYPAVAEMIKSAYKNVDYSDHREQFMVERLRSSGAFIPELSLVAEAGHKIVGHIMLTRIVIRNQQEAIVSLCLAPLSIAPEFQGQGVGTQLVTDAHRIAKELGYRSVTVLGHPKYYPRFGYEPMKKHGIQVPFDIREENCMIVSLTEYGLTDVRGKVEYPLEFMDQV